MSCSYKKLVSRLAKHCEACITRSMMQDPHRIQQYFAEFEDFVRIRYPQVHIADVFRCKIYNWYHGNAITYVLTFMFFPELYIPEPVVFTRDDIHQMIRIIRDLIIIHKVDPNEKNAYEETALQLVVASATLGQRIESDQVQQLIFLTKYGQAAPSVQMDVLHERYYQRFPNNSREKRL